ncbi:MAG: RCC1 domain-containing protein, partial [Roseiflexaceae bacterium]
MPPGKTFATLFTNGAQACALSTDGVAYCWGNFSWGIGACYLPPFMMYLTPTRVGSGCASAATDTPTATNTSIRTSTRTNTNTRTNTSTRTATSTRTLTRSATPVPGSNPWGTFTQISAGGSHTCALTSLGAAYCWGWNTNGQLGDGTTTDRSAPVAVSMPTGVTFTQIDAGQAYTCALTSAGIAYCWGKNSVGQLGDGTTTDRSIPMAVSMPAGVTFASISAGYTHTCALTSAGAAYCWGANGFGQLGDGTTTDSSTPVAVSMPSSVTFTSITAGKEYTCALTSAGAAYCWGKNNFGQLGDGTYTDKRSTPVAVSMPAGVTFASISVGYEHTCALTSAGAAYCWGANGFGQLGDGTTTDRNTPV